VNCEEARPKRRADDRPAVLHVRKLQQQQQTERLARKSA
jgi:hypothetical protein